MQLRSRRLTPLIALHLVVFLVACGAGWLQADASPAPRSPGVFWTDAMGIAMNNSRAMLLLVTASVLTFGLAGLALFVSNGFAFGSVIGTMGLHPWVLLYAPVEVLLFAWAAAIALRVTIAVITWLRHDVPIDAALLWRSAAGVAAAVALLLPTALLEALAIEQGWSP